MVWNTSSHRVIARLDGLGAGVTGLAFSRDGTTITGAGSNGASLTWRVRELDHPGVALGHHAAQDLGVGGLAFSPNSRLLASGGGSWIYLWDTVTHVRLAALKEPFAGRLAFSPDGTRLASEERLNTIRLWDVSARSPRRMAALASPNTTFKDPDLNGVGRPEVSDFAFGPKTDILGSVWADGTVIFWSARTGKRLGRPLRAAADKLAFGPDGKLMAVAVATEPPKVELRRTNDRSQLGPPLRVGGESVERLAFSPDGHTLAVAVGSSIELWDVSTHEQWRAPSAGHNTVVDMAFAPDGRTLVTADYEGRLILWDVASGELIIDPIRVSPATQETRVAISPDGSAAAFGAEEGTVFLWKPFFGSDDMHAIEAAFCRQAGRNLSRVEWEEFLPREDYRRTCPERPE